MQADPRKSATITAYAVTFVEVNIHNKLRLPTYYDMFKFMHAEYVTDLMHETIYLGEEKRSYETMIAKPRKSSNNSKDSGADSELNLLGLDFMKNIDKRTLPPSRRSKLPTTIIIHDDSDENETADATCDKIVQKKTQPATSTTTTIVALMDPPRIPKRATNPSGLITPSTKAKTSTITSAISGGEVNQRAIASTTNLLITNKSKAKDNTINANINEQNKLQNSTLQDSTKVIDKNILSSLLVDRRKPQANTKKSVGKANKSYSHNQKPTDFNLPTNTLSTQEENRQRMILILNNQQNFEETDTNEATNIADVEEDMDEEGNGKEDDDIEYNDTEHEGTDMAGDCDSMTGDSMGIQYYIFNLK